MPDDFCRHLVGTNSEMFVTVTVLKYAFWMQGSDHVDIFLN